ncbi:MAG: hypothetical protein IT244_06435 [Bacteroidia bacterium]|nr:hypothetical protein [Bacteroidia bacterium]
MKNALILSFSLLVFAACKKQYTSKSSLKEVNPENSMVIHYSNSGCFSSTTETLTIFKVGSGYKYKLEHTMNNSTLVTEGKCSAAFPKAYENFEKEGRGYVSQNNCTSVSSWKIVAPSKTIEFGDGDCKLMGYYQLKETLQ